MRIHSRSEWGARAPGPVATGNRPVREAFIHHSEDDYRDYDSLGKQQAKVRAIQDFHMDSKGWSDIGYHFLIFQPLNGIRTARIFRGRTNSDVVPAAQLNHNQHTLAVCVIGNGAIDDMKQSTMDAIVSVLHLYSTLTTLGGHRDVVATQCPGDLFYRRIPELARRAHLKVL